MKATLSASLVIAFTLATGLSAQTMGYKLAVIEKKGYVSENDPLVKRFENIITQLDLNYIENKEQIGDKTVTGKNQLERVGIRTNDKHHGRYKPIRGIYTLKRSSMVIV